MSTQPFIKAVKRGNKNVKPGIAILEFFMGNEGNENDNTLSFIKQ